ncbi:MAG: hypothetical protein FJ224_00795 [Lentisphaerae bacterium]|nr:hypothetical protein [Lentisphaerota bacterium]
MNFVYFNPDSIYHPKRLQQQEMPDAVCRSAMGRTFTHKLVRRSNGKHEFCDLARDPGELLNRFWDPACAAQRTDLTALLCERLIATSDSVPSQRDPRRFPPGFGGSEPAE